jgi:antirestriction protein
MQPEVKLIHAGADPALAVEPALYCCTYAKYNRGSIAGKWLKLHDYDGIGAFLQACREVHRDEADPELMFQDYEGMPDQLFSESLSEAGLQKLYDWLQLGNADRRLLDEYLDATGYSFGEVDVQDVRSKLYCILDYPFIGDHNTAMGWHVIDEGLIVAPDNLRCYINFETLGRDWLSDFSVSTNGYVFTD